MRTRILAGAFLVSSSAFCQDGPYIGMEIGFFDYQERIPPYSFTDAAPIYKVYGGYRFNRRWAVEAYRGTTATLKDAVFSPIPAGADFDITEIRGLAHFGTFMAGIGYWDPTFSTSTMLSGPGGSNFCFTLGGEWSLNDWDLRLEAESFNTDEAHSYFDLDHSTHAVSLSFGAQYTFGAGRK